MLIKIPSLVTRADKQINPATSYFHTGTPPKKQKQTGTHTHTHAHTHAHTHTLTHTRTHTHTHTHTHAHTHAHIHMHAHTHTHTHTHMCALIQKMKAILAQNNISSSTEIKTQQQINEKLSETFNYVQLRAYTLIHKSEICVVR